MSAATDDKTSLELAEQFQAHSSRSTYCKQQLLENSARAFEGGANGARGLHIRMCVARLNQ